MPFLRPARTAAPTPAPQLERPDRRAPRQVRIAGGPYVLDTFFDPARGRPVTVAPFWLDVTEVTASQFAQCVAAGSGHVGIRRVGLTQRKAWRLNTPFEIDERMVALAPQLRDA